jgi:DNA-binding SARP family transcriptional activator
MGTELADSYLKAVRYEQTMRGSAALLKEDRCDEVAHRQLMRAYAAQGRRSDALRQYQFCARILAEELGAQLLPETIRLFQAILNVTTQQGVLRGTVHCLAGARGVLTSLPCRRRWHKEGT